MENRKNRENPLPGELYRHFKGNLYQIITVAREATCGEPYVVYQALYGAFGIWVRPLKNFMEPADRTKYPDAEQYWRFERVFREDENICDDVRNERGTDSSRKSRDILMSFLNETSISERQNILRKGAIFLRQEDLDSICTVCDLPKSEGSIDDQISAVIRSLKLKEQYEAKRCVRLGDKNHV